MFVDASALVAILLREIDGPALEDRLAAAAAPTTSPLAIFETVFALVKHKRIDFDRAEADVLDYLESAWIQIVPITAEIGRLALVARARYGKGTGHRARLNLGDCFAYACAKAHGVALLYKGDDFVHTDLA